MACLLFASGSDFREFTMSFQHENTIFFRKFKYILTLILTKFNIKIDTLYYHAERPSKKRLIVTGGAILATENTYFKGCSVRT